MALRGEEARRRYEDAVAQHRRAGDSRRLAHALRHLGEVETAKGRLDVAEACLEEALSLYRPMEGVGILELANAVRPLALLREAQGRRCEAREAWLEARGMYRRAGIQAGVDECDDHLDGDAAR